MAWPLSQDYNEAIQDARGSFSDPELRQAEVVTNALGLPMPRSGNFADVYEVRSADGRTRWAVKCFTRQVVGLRERYSEISKYLRQVQLPFMVDFQYLEQGIRVRGAWYPVLKMHWVEGFLLNEFVRENLDKPILLKGLGQIWLRMARKLREAKFAHCDLQHGNVILVPGSTASSLAVKLIDYDGMFVPALAGSKSGEVGHPAYQHPQRLQTGAYHAEVDRFPLLVIATAMQALSVAGRSLWERYDNGDNMLFRQGDLQNPAQSPLFAELRQVRDPLTQTLVAQLQQSCGQPLEKAPLLESLFPEEKVATAPRPSVVRTAAAASKAAAAPGGEWDFTSSAPATSVVRRRRQQGIPGWVWAVGGAAAALLLMVGAAGAFWMLMGRSPTPMAQQQTNTTRKKPSTQLADAGPPKEEPPEHREEGPPDKEQRIPKEPVDPPPPLGQGQPDDPKREPKEPVVVQPPANRQVFPDLFHVAATPTAHWMAWTEKHGRVWHLSDPKKIHYPPFEGHTDAVLCIAFSADCQRMLTGGADRTVRLWSLADGQKPLHTFEGHTKPVTSVAISPDGRWGASADGGPEVRVWDLDRREKLRTLTHPRGVRALAFEAGGTSLLCGLDRAGEADHKDACYRWDVTSGTRSGPVFLRQSDAVTCMAVSPDGQWMVAGGESAFTIVPLGPRAGRRFVRPIPLEREGGPAHHIAFSRDSKRFLVSAEKEVYLCGVNGVLLLIHRRPENDRLCACFSSDEKKIFLAHRQSYHVHNELLDLPPMPEVVVNPRPRPPRPPVPRPVEKLPVPDKAEVKAAREKVRQEYKDDYALLKKDPTGKAIDELNQKLIQRGGKQDEEPVYRYALLREGYDLAVAKPDLWRAFWAVTVMDNAFAISPLAEHAAAVEAAARAPEAQRNYFLLDKALEVAEEAIGADDFGRAERLMAIAVAAGQHNHSANTQALVMQRSRRLQGLRKEYKRVEAAAKKLAKAPDDADACLAVGRFQCFHKGDWQRGLPLLEKGSDKLLALLARGERGVGEDTRNQVGFGDMWWEQADKDAPNREGIRERARYWYRRALPHLEGEDKARVEKRLSMNSKAGPLKPGLVVELFADSDLNKKVASRVDYQIDFRWGTGSPDVQVPAEAFSVRWTGWLLLPESGGQHLQTSCRGGFRIWLDGKPLNNQWNNGGNHSNGLDMAAGLHLFQVEYRKTDVPAEIILSWVHPPGKKGGPIPIELLYHDRQQEKGLELPRKKP